MSDDDAEEYDSVANTIHGALQSVAPSLSGKSDAMLSKWVTIAEWIAEDGTRWLTRVGDDQAVAWDRIGLLESALVIERKNWEAD